MKPYISVVVPAFNEEQFLPRLLTSLQLQKNAPTFEVIVVDNNSTDKTANVAKDFGAQVVFEKKAGPAFACNTGFKKATGTIIVRTDADTVVPTNWLEQITKSFQKDDSLIALGGPIYPLESTRLENMLYYPALLFWTFCLRLTKKGYFVTQVAFRKEVLKKSNGYKTDLVVGEDIEFSKRLSKLGKIRFLFSLYIYSSTRRMRVLGLLQFVKNYPIKNHIAYCQGKLDKLTFTPVRFVPKETPEPRNPLFYLWQLPLAVTMIVILFGFISLTNNPDPDQIFESSPILAMAHTKITLMANQAKRLPTPILFQN